MNCPGCNKPMLDGQVFNGLYGCHWGCTDAVRGQETLDEKGVELAKKVLEMVAGRVDTQLAKLEEAVQDLDIFELPITHPIYSCMINNKDAIVCYDTHGTEGEPGFAICKDFSGRKQGSVVLDVHDAQSLCDQLVKFLVGQEEAKDEALILSCRTDPDDCLMAYEARGEMAISTDSIVHLDRDAAILLRDRLNRFIVATD